MGKQLVAIERNDYEEIVVFLENAKVDADKFYYKNNKAAGIRLRVALRNVERLCATSRRASLKMAKMPKKNVEKNDLMTVMPGDLVNPNQTTLL